MVASTHVRHAAWVICLGAACLRAVAQQAPAPQAPPAPVPPGMVMLAFPESVDLKVLIEYVSQRQQVNFLYDEQIASKHVTIKAPQPIPADSLMTLLESVLKMNGLSLTPTEVPGMMRIEIAKQLTAVSVGPDAAPGAGAAARPTLAVTRVFELRHTTPQRIEQVLTPFFSAPTANLTALPEHGLVIVTDYADNMKRLEDLIATVDRPAREVSIEYVPVTYMEATAMAQKVTSVLAGKAKARDAGTKDLAGGVTVVADERTNQVVVIGGADDVVQTVAMIKSLDVPLGTTTKIYTFTAASADRVDSLVKKLIGELAAKRLYQSATDRDSNLLIATTTPEIHEQIDALRQTLDKPVTEEQSPVRFYKLENAKALDVLTTLMGIEGESGLGGVTVDGVSAEPKAGMTPEVNIKGPTEAEVNQGAGAAVAAARGKPARHSLELRNARVMADEPSNTIIVVASPSMQAVYEKLIKRLDIRRPQVLVEATIVAIDTTNEFSLGVEISKGGSVNNGEGKTINFSSFGLSTPDPTTGALTLKPGVGFNGAILTADIANIIIRALQTDKRVKVVSRPSVLINDNASGTLLSQTEEPFASVNASTTVATTSFGGYSSAGTTITVKPQISESDYLKLEYEVTLSSFGEDGSAALPPSRQKNSLASEATIPNGSTIVVGGLTRDNLNETIDRIPILGSIPGLEYLFSNRSKSSQKTTLFVFIHAVILRDDQFKDLKMLSGDAAGRAELPGDYPASEPVEIKRDQAPAGDR